MANSKATADDETLVLLRDCLRGGAGSVTGQVLAEDGPVGEPSRAKAGGGYFYVFATPEREITTKAVRFEAVLADGRELAAEVPVRSRTVPAGGIAFVAVPDAPGLQGDAPENRALPEEAITAAPEQE